VSESTRDWGPWSVWKTELILGAYLPDSLRAGRGALHRVFIDGFAGAVDNFERGSGRPVRSSPVLALEDDDPGFTHLVFHELPAKAESLRRELSSRFGNRRIKVIPGDCNDTIGAGLTWLSSQGTGASGPHLGQILAYLDPNNHTQLRWKTIENLATVFRQPSMQGRPVRRRPIELLVLFPALSMKRCLPTATGTVRATGREIAIINAFFGSDDWQAIYDDQRQGMLTGNHGWRLYVDLYRAQLKIVGTRTLWRLRPEIPRTECSTTRYLPRPPMLEAK
jgi:three-Cys-motif partner protein